MTALPVLRVALPAALFLAVASAAAQDAGTAASPPPTADDQTPADLKLRLSRELSPPIPPKTKSAKTGASPAKPLPQGTAIPPAGEAERGALFLRADRIEGDEKRVEASGKVELRSHRETVLADWISYDIESSEIHGKGNVTLRRGLDSVTGPELRFNRDDETGFFTEPKFVVGEAGARGDAEKLTFLGNDRYDVDKGRYTTCIAPREDWFLETRDLEIDNARKIGTAHDATVRFFGTPVFYSPWLEFPLSNERKSGFLTPTAGVTGVRGFELALPYYFNLAPNYDATLTPRVMTRRGLQIGGQFRYLFNSPSPMTGETNIEVLPDDRQTRTFRWLVATRHNQQFTPSFAGYWNASEVSDNLYFADLADRVQVTSQTTLPRETGLTYAAGPLTMLARVQGYQTLQDPSAPITPPYNRLPQLLATLNETEWGGLAWTGMAEYANFRQPQLTQGERAVLYPQASWSRQGPAWFVAARASVHVSQYNLLNQLPGVDARPSVVVPIGSLDAGLTFERDWTVFGRSFVQTLEPRAYYVYIPFRNQNQLPVFDTTTDDFNFSQLFSENRYLGHDRVGDANQLTVALTSRLLDPATGVERLRAAVGQRFYFSSQQVTLPGEVPQSASSSDLLFGTEGRITDQWSLNGLLQLNLDSGQTERLNAGVRWMPAPGKVFNAVYRYTAQNADPSGTELKQFDLSAEWPIGGRWTALGRWNYSLANSKTLEAIAGVEYNADCWVLRLVYHRLATTTQQTNTSVYVQLEFNGLARVGTSPLELLRRSIPGYLRSNDPSRFVDPGILPYPEY